MPRAGNPLRGDGTFRFFSTRKRNTSSSRNGFEPASYSRQPDSVSLRPENRQWTFNLAHHSPLWNFQDSLTPSNNHLRIPLLRPLLRYSSRPSSSRRFSPSAFLTEPFRIMESLAEGRIVPLNARPYIFIFRCRMDEEKKTEQSPAYVFFIFLLRQPTFLLKNFCILRISSHIANILRDLK